MDPNSPSEGAPGRPAAPEVPYIVAEAVPTSLPPRRRLSAIGTVLVVLLVLALGGSLLVNLILVAASFPFEPHRRVRERFVSHNRLASNKIAIIPIRGVIVGNEDGFVKRAIDQALKDEAVKAVVLRVDSPGGTVSGSDYYYHHLRKLAEQRGIPLVVSMGGVAASGGYYVSMAVGGTEGCIFAEPTTWTGSIGVIIPHYNFARLMEELGVKEDSIVSGRFKNMGSFARPMTEEERRLFQNLVNSSFNRFKDIIKQGRPYFQQHPDALSEIATGQIFSADEALQHHLIDRIGYIEDAIDRAIQLAGLAPEDVRVVKYEREFSLFEDLLSLESRRSSFDLPGLLELSSPRAYYLSTRLPLMLSSSD